MSELRVQEIHSPNDQTGGIEIDNNDNVLINGQALPQAGPLSNRNLIINGAMNVAQRGTSSTLDGYRTVDRFSFSRAQGATQQDQISINDGNGQLAPIWNAGFRNFYRITNTTGSTAADSVRTINHFVEAQSLATSGWVHDDPNSDITLSFWVRASVSQRYWVGVETQAPAGSEQTFVFPIQDEGANTLSANTWTRIVQTIPGHANVQINNNTARGIRIVFGAWWGTNFTGTGDTEQWRDFDAADRVPDMDDDWVIVDGSTFDITGVQLEVGSVATPFEHRTFGDELVKCQRYFTTIEGRRLAGGGNNTTAIILPVFTPVNMRATPTVEDLDLQFARKYDSVTAGSLGSAVGSVVARNANVISVNMSSITSVADNTSYIINAAFSLSAEL